MIELRRGDITTVEADAIVNAANSALRGGGGVDGAIHSAAGPRVMDELRTRYPNGTPTGTAVVTGAGLLRARFIIHAVGPIWRGGGAGEEELLTSAYRDSLLRGSEVGARTVAFPAISCGIYGYPVSKAAPIAIRTVQEHVSEAPGIDRMIFVLRSADVMAAFETALVAASRGTGPPP